jgi:hypothetical protein
MAVRQRVATPNDGRGYLAGARALVGLLGPASTSQSDGATYFSGIAATGTSSLTGCR